MASLLEKATLLRDRLRLEESIQSIPEEERSRIYRDIDRAVDSGRLKISESTFSFPSRRNDSRLPLIINLAAFLLITGLGLIFLRYFDQAEMYIISPPENLQTAEGRILQALRAESEERLAQKDLEIQSISGMLETARIEQLNLEGAFREEAGRIETRLRIDFERQLEEERRRLVGEGLTDEALAEGLRVFELDNQEEFRNRLEIELAELEGENLERERALRERISAFELDLKRAEVDRVAAQEELERRLTDQGLQLATERDEALAKLRDLDSQQRQEQLVLDQIFSMYGSVNEAIRSGIHEKALENLDSLEGLLGQTRIATLPAIAYRRDIDLFMIRSLRRLIGIEQTAAAVDTDGADRKETDPQTEILEAVTGLVERGNELFEQGEMQSAREQYLMALSRVPALDDGVSRLRRIDEIDLLRERQDFRRVLSEGDRHFSSEDFTAAIEKYRQALEYLENDSAVVNRIVDRLLAAGIGKETAGGRALIALQELELLNRAKLEAAERHALLEELDYLEAKFTGDRSVPEGNGIDAKENLAALLNTKLLIREVLASESIREDYPDLYDKLNSYLDAYGKEREREGRDAALAELVSLMEHLSGGPGSGRPVPALAEEWERRELFLRFLRNLKSIIEL